jgi:hypothetical protein
MSLLDKILVGLNDVDDQLSTGQGKPPEPALTSAGGGFRSARPTGKLISSPLPQQSSQVVQASQLPLELSLSDYKDAYSNANPKGDIVAAQKFQQLVDSAPELNHGFMTSTSSIENTYGLILDGLSCSAENTFLTSMVAKAKRIFKSSAQASFAGQSEWRLVEAVPHDWYVDDKSRYKKVNISLDNKSKEESSLNLISSKSSQTILTVGNKKMALSKSTRFTHCELEYMLVRFVRPWMNFTLFEAGGWWLEGQQPGFCSSGKTDVNGGILPLINTGMILARSAKFQGDWDPSDRKIVNDQLGSNKDVYIGPYKLLKDEGVAKTVTLAAWISELVPFSPRTEAPVG